MDESYIAGLDLLAVAPDGGRRPVALRVGAPERGAGGAWRCALRLDGLHAGLPAMEGDDAVQALCLALGLAAALLRDFVGAGGRLLDAGGRDEWPLEAYFGWLGAPQAPAA
jgi:hypothetical protein